MGLNKIYVLCDVISGDKDNGDDIDLLFTLNLIEPPRCMINH